MSEQNLDDGPKVVVHEIDHAEEERKRLKAQRQERESGVRAGYVSGLENELAYLERQPTPNARRIADVKEQLAQYAEKPEKARRESAVPEGAPKAPEAQKPPEAVSNSGPSADAQAAAPAKKAAAEKPTPAKKAAAKKTAAAK